MGPKNLWSCILNFMNLQFLEILSRFQYSNSSWFSKKEKLITTCFFPFRIIPIVSRKNILLTNQLRVGSDFERLVGSKTEKVTEIMNIRIGENKGQLSTGKLFAMFVSFETSGDFWRNCLVWLHYFYFQLFTFINIEKATRCEW